MKPSILLFALGAAACSPPPPAATAPPPPDVWLAAGDVGAPIAAPPAPAVEPTGKDFIDDARLLFRVAACAGDDAVPEGLDAQVVEAHCAELRPKLEAYRRRYVGVASPFLAALAPQAAPTSVVYPFGGGDLMTAITAFPAAREYTTLSLELAGDPRRLRGAPRDVLRQSLAKLRRQLDELIFIDDYSRSETLKRTQRGEIPGELGFFLVALAVHGLRPVSLRYFQVEPSGSLRYLTSADIDALDHVAAERRKQSWAPPDFSEAFANAEIRFVADKAPATEPPRVHRHLAANLSDAELATHPGVLRHLATKGPVLAITKAASYLLWKDDFSSIRGYLLDHATFMVSDSTGLPPAFAERGGFVQETYGEFSRSLLFASGAHNAAFRALWRKQPKRKLPFRFGYKDGAGHDHLLVTRKPEAAR